MTDWNLEAKKVAEYVGTNLFEAHRGALAKPNGIVVVFGNDGYESGDRAKREVETVRKVLPTKDPSSTELGFGVCDGGYTWVLLYRTNNKREAECLAAEATLVVWRGWNEACQADGCEPFLLNVQYEVQHGIAERVIGEHVEV